MAVKLIEVTRGEVVETIYRGDAVVVNTKGEIIAYAGNPYKFTYMRSAAKPLQAINVIISGAFDKFEISLKELAVICSSHYAEPFHRDAVASLLKKAGLSENHILGGIVTSLNQQYALQLASKKTKLTPLFSDCSGKHAGMLAVCCHHSYDIKNYLSPHHPCQKEILDILAYMCSMKITDFKIGIDGCSAPVHAMPLYNMALGYARLANPAQLEKKYRNAAQIIFNAMTMYPEMISGTGGFCSNLIKETNGKLIGKVGAEGVYCVGIKDKNMGIAVKIESGSMAVLPPVVIKILRYLKILNREELKTLEKYHIMDNTNDVGTIVGYIKPVFKLKTRKQPSQK